MLDGLQILSNKTKQHQTRWTNAKIFGTNQTMFDCVSSPGISHLFRAYIYIFAIFLHVITFFCQTEMETVDVLRLAQLHNQTDRVYHEMNSKEKVNT